MTRQRCKWCERDEALQHYHDHIWGHPKQTDEQLFEALTFEAFQSGLKWETIYRKRQGFREAFAQFNIDAVARLTEAKQEALRENPAIIRHRLKIAATVYNAGQVQAIQTQYGSFLSYVDTLPEDTRIRELCKRFKFIGPTSAESFLMACGYLRPVHEETCFLHPYKNAIV